jgi:hypothetical protein
MSLPSYDPVQLALRETQQLSLFDAQPRARRDYAWEVQKALKALEWIEFAEESIGRAESDCLVEYSEESHQQLERSYADWVQSSQRLATDAERAGDLQAAGLRQALERAQRWLKTQADIVAHSLPHATLSEMAQRAGLSDGVQSAHPPTIDR